MKYFALLATLNVFLAWGQPRPLERAKAPNNLTNPALPPWTPEVLNRLRVPSGFRIEVFASGVGNPRMMAVSDSGAVYVTRRKTGDVIVIRNKQTRIVAQGLPYAHGIHIFQGVIYIATDRHVYRAPLGTETGMLDLTRIIGDLPDAGQHPNRTLAVGPDNMLYISVGSTCNACPESNPQNATLQQSGLDGSGRTTYARGLRNTIGFDWHPITRELWGIDVGSDSRGDNIPPEELNRIDRGGHYGWPWCYGNRQVDRLIAQAPPDQTREAFCAMTKPPMGDYQAHTSPINFVFAPRSGALWPDQYRGDAYLSMRGSWNRDQPVGYKIVRQRFAAGQPAGSEDFITGWLSADGLTAYGRPTGIAFHIDGSMLISDDQNGVIYRVSSAAQPNP